MKEIIIKVAGTGFQNECQALITIWHHNNRIISQKTYNGIVKCCLKTKQLYKIIIKARTIEKEYYIFIDNKRCCYPFSLYDSSERIITFQLTDANYNNLPIEKGEIFLWQKQ